MAALPISGQASTYSDYFKGRLTSSGEVYSHAGYTAALLPKARWYAVPLGTLVRLTYNGKVVVVKINDRGAGDGTMARVLDLSRAAYAYLIGKTVDSVTDANAGVVQLSLIEIVPPGTAVGPVAS